MNKPKGKPVRMKTPSPGPLDSTTTLPLTHIAELTGEHARQLQRLCETGMVERPERKGHYNVYQVVRGTIGYYKAKAANKDDGAAEDKRITQRAEAEIAQLKSAEAQGKLCGRKNVEEFWADHAAKLSAAIRTARFLKDEQKKKLFEIILSIKLAEFDPEKAEE